MNVSPLGTLDPEPYNGLWFVDETTPLSSWAPLVTPHLSSSSWLLFPFFSLFGRLLICRGFLCLIRALCALFLDRFCLVLHQSNSKCYSVSVRVSCRSQVLSYRSIQNTSTYQQHSQGLAKFVVLSITSAITKLLLLNLFGMRLACHFSIDKFGVNKEKRHCEAFDVAGSESQGEQGDNVPI